MKNTPSPTSKPCILIAANVPLWFIPGLEHLKHSRHYATWLEPLIPEFEKHSKNFDLHWLTFSKEATEESHHQAFGQNFHVFPRKYMSLSIFTAHIREILKVRKLVKAIQPDLFHAWGSEESCALAGAYSGIKKRLFTLQGCLTEYVHLLGGNLYFRTQAAYEPHAVRRFPFGTAESPDAGKLLLGLNPKMDVTLIDYGVNREFFEASWQPANTPVLAFVGGVSERKGIQDLVKIAAQPELSHIQFKILGDGPARSHLSSISTDNVIWCGNCSRDEVVNHLSSAWGLIMPTYVDTGPTVVKEARVMGLPIITTTGAGAADYIKTGECGHVIEPGDKQALTSAVIDVCSSIDKCIELGKHSLDEHRFILHPSTTAQKFIELYTKIVSLEH